MKGLQFADGIARFDSCMACGRRHRAGSTAALVCARRVRKTLDATPMPLMLDTGDMASERVGGTD